MNLYDHPEWRAMVAGVMAHPECDQRRRVAADWLRDRNEWARADYIERELVNPSPYGSCMGDRSVGQYCPMHWDYRKGDFCPACERAIAFGLPRELAGKGDSDSNSYEYRRGFLHTLRADWRKLVEFLPKLVKREPIQFVQPIGFEITSYANVRPGARGWIAVDSHYGIRSPFGYAMPGGMRRALALFQSIDLERRHATRADAETYLSNQFLTWARERP